MQIKQRIDVSTPEMLSRRLRELGDRHVERWMKSVNGRAVTNLGLKAEASGTEGGATRLGAPPLPEGKWLPHRGSSVESRLFAKYFYSLAIEKDPKNAIAINQLALLLEPEGERRRALELFRRAERLLDGGDGAMIIKHNMASLERLEGRGRL
ncbi:MAG: tetratricopeptide repeat protein [Candidatus Micrarchaeota archaeon]|nr:tetratricopeptide repeat protein [Candidatus Micrarchaeota archaeon]